MAGESFWTETLDDPMRWKLWYAVEAAIERDPNLPTLNNLADKVREWVVTDLGMPSLAGMSDSMGDIRTACLEGEEDVVFSVLEGVALGLRAFWGGAETWERSPVRDRIDRFVASVQSVFLEYRLKFRFDELQVVPLESESLHVEVVERALRLVHRAGWEMVEKAYRDALGEIHNGKPEDAITDAAVALEEALKVRGAEGNSLSKKMDSARRRGIFGPHDAPLLNAIKSVGDWIAADRSESGDSHEASPTGLSNAWLMVHIVGALIVRLSDPELRSLPEVKDEEPPA